MKATNLIKGHLVLTAPKNTKKILLHTCCAPCSSAIIECLLYNDIQPTIFYYNPNIFPIEEYQKRKQECIRFAQSLQLSFIDADYDYAQWRTKICGLENEPERGKRCLKCFEMRLTETARYAAENDFSVIATTLASSRWKNLEQINLAGTLAAEKYGITFWQQNWRKGGLSERRATIIKAYKFYNQPYCGCEFSRKKD